MNKIFNFLFFTAFYIGGIFASDIEFEADKTFLDSENESLILEGNVSLKFDEFLFEAKKVTLDKKNNLFSGESLSFSTLDNFLYGTTNFVSVSSGETSLKEVEFSSCPCADKIWWIESDELIFKSKENVLTAKNSKLIVQGTTLAYLNRAKFPISARRKSGILLPEISINERSGMDIKVPVYLNLKKNLDLTIEPRLMTQRGFGVTNELRYLGKDYEGNLNSSILVDDESSYKTLERDNLRWSYNLSHNQSFGKSTFLDLNTSSTGDPFYLSDLGSFMSGLSRTYVLPQKLDVNYFFKNFSLKADINSFKLTNPLAQNQFQRLPGLKLSYFFNKNNLNFSFNSDFAYLRKGGSFRNDENQSLKKIFIKPSLSHSFFKKNYFLKSSFITEYLFQSFDGQNNSEFLSSLSLKQSLKFYREERNIKTFVEPFIDFLISDQKKIINQLKVDSGLKLSSINESQKFGSLFLSFQKDFNIGTKFSFFNKNKDKISLKISKLYTPGKKSLYYENLKVDFPDTLSLKFDYKSSHDIDFISRIAIDNKDNFSSYKNSLRINKKTYKISLSHFLVEDIKIYNLNSRSQINKKINSLEFSSSFNISNKWSGGYKFINDLEQEKNVNNVFSLDYENDGLIVGISYMKSIELDWISILEKSTFKDYHKDRIRIFFELKGLGSIGRPKENYLQRRSL